VNAQEHFRWAVDRAMEYVEMGDGTNALNSLISDLRKHERTAHIMANLEQLATGLLMLDLRKGGNGAEEMRRFIKGIPEPM
jgi:hypothetical protein